MAQAVPLEGHPVNLMLKLYTVARPHRRLPLALAVAAIAIIVAAPTDTFAQSRHRARLSGDIADRLARRVEASTSIILSAADARIDELVARYGVRLKKRLNGAAVLEATGGQIDALSQDPDVAHIASDAKVFRQMAVTTQATGADQLWSGLQGLPGLT